MMEINKSRTTAIETSERVKIVRNRLQHDAQRVQQRKEEAERDLEEAIPHLEAAKEALMSIKQKDINLLKTLANPHNLIQRIMDAVLILHHKTVIPAMQDETVHMGKHRFPRLKTSWRHSLVFLRERGFLRSLLDFPKEKLNDETIELLEPYLNQSDFGVDSGMFFLFPFPISFTSCCWGIGHRECLFV